MKTMRDSEVAVTLSPELYELLTAEARGLNVPFEMLVASLVCDTLEEAARPVAAAASPTLPGFSAGMPVAFCN